MKNLLIAVAIWLIMAGRAWALGGIADVTVYDRGENRVLPIYYHQGQYYVAGRPGAQYQVNVRNNQGQEILAVVSVDGVNAVSGETANWGQSGYVLGPNVSYGVKGWRKSTQRVAAFEFTELDNSYAARTGRPDNVGVIGVALFRKKVEPPVGVLRDYRRNQAQTGKLESAEPQAPASAASDAAAPRAPAVVAQPQMREKSLGTGHGGSEVSVVRYANFERASQTPDEVISIYYDSYRNLIARGVIADATRIARPQPFPGQFVPDPR